MKTSFGSAEEFNNGHLTHFINITNILPTIFNWLIHTVRFIFCKFFVIHIRWNIMNFFDLTDIERGIDSINNSGCERSKFQLTLLFNI